STRMGRPKHLIRSDGTTWLERTVGLLEQVTARVVILGAGQVPAGLSQIVRLADVRDAEGPMAGLLAAMRWEPAVSWLLAPCDHPDLSVEALEWLLSTRRPGLWATLPRLDSSPSVEPLLAHYDFRAAPLLESAAGGHEFSLSRIAAHAKVISPTPPAALAAAWQDVDTPA
ncbi:MAG: NTP transferase domain-containing protein, partial [Anaerolineaceae bacterium]|nr:NTP transferase domain-containing protein [Anaerolineaceae bacterium]